MKHKTMAVWIIMISVFVLIVCLWALGVKLPDYLLGALIIATGDIGWARFMMIFPICWVLLVPVFIAFVQFIKISRSLYNDRFLGYQIADRLTKISSCFFAIGVFAALSWAVLVIIGIPLNEIDTLTAATLGLFGCYILCSIASQLVVEATEPRFLSPVDPIKPAERFSDS